MSDHATELPADCSLALISRGDGNSIPHAGDEIERDHLTFIGRRDAVREAIDYCNSDA